MANIQNTAGQYIPTPLQKVLYGRGVIHSLPALLSELGCTKAFIVTGTSLQSKTPVIKQIEEILGNKWVRTYSKIAQHAPVSAIKEAAEDAKRSGVDVFISVGGGSPIDSVKVIIHSLQMEHGGEFLPHIAIPTTLSVAETTQMAGYTSEKGHKIGISHPNLCPRQILYDANLAMYTPLRLWLSSGMRALDHAIEMLYHPMAPETPNKLLSLSVVAQLVKLLPRSMREPENEEVRQRLQVVAFGSLFSILAKGGLGLSHSMGHALGASYQIPHGITSCLTLSPVLRHKALTSPPEANQIARLVPFLGLPDKGSDKENALQVAERVALLVQELGLKSTLTEYHVPQTQEEMEGIAERAVHNREGDDFKAVVEIVKGMY